MTKTPERPLPRNLKTSELVCIGGVSLVACCVVIQLTRNWYFYTAFVLSILALVGTFFVLIVASFYWLDRKNK
jgi:hypothetical protein